MGKFLVLGGYGLIGSACMTALKQRGADVVGMGRSAKVAQSTHPDIDWIISDIGTASVAEWKRHLEGVDVVISAAGALQDGARDTLGAIHEDAIARICEAARGSGLRFVQISAAGVSEDAPTEFFRSKARGDARLQSSDLEWVILRPTLVIGSNAYGGTALLRGVAGFPVIGPRVFENSPVQTISLEELAEAVADAALGAVPMRRIYDLTEPDARGFDETVLMVRKWLGLEPYRLRLPVPGLAFRLSGLVADGLGWLGWRSPVRSTALRTIAEGVAGDPTPWRAAGGRDFRSLPETLSRMPATLQDRWFARLYLLFPLAVAILSLFWLASGLIGLWKFDLAVAVMTERGFAAGAATIAVASGSVADILLGALILYRPLARHACLGMVLVAGAYLLGATVFAADLWSDPLGPMLKVLPSIGLALVVYAMLEER